MNKDEFINLHPGQFLKSDHNKIYKVSGNQDYDVSFINMIEMDKDGDEWVEIREVRFNKYLIKRWEVIIP